MAAIGLAKRKAWKLSRNVEGHRNYTLKMGVSTNNPLDGPAIVANAPGLPVVGSTWSWGNDVDIWAFCTPELTVTPRINNEPNQEWDVDLKFNTKPQERCQDDSIENPLFEPQKISGSFVKYTKQVQEDKDGNKILTSSHEIITGPIIEFDDNRANVVIEQNVASLGLETFTEMVDKVNDAGLWGLGTRKIKLSNVSWSRKLYGTCTFYYTRQFTFDINFEGFDRKAVDEGNKVLKGDWVNGLWVTRAGADSTDPSHFIQFKDEDGENSKVLLNTGVPLKGAEEPIEIDINYYKEADLTTLGIPLTL